MLATGVSIQGSSLKLLSFGERGTINRINPVPDATAQKLNQMGLRLGRMIIIEQRFPRFIVRSGNTCHTLDETMINAIRVRLIEH